MTSNALVSWVTVSGASRAGPRHGHSTTAVSTVITTIEIAASQATGRQRRDGSRPSGNSKGTKVSASPKPGAQAHWATHGQPAARGQPGTVRNP